MKIIVIFFCLFILLGVYFVRVSNTILDVGDTNSEAMLTVAVYNALAEASSQGNYNYNEFFTITTNKTDDVTSVITNGINVSLFTADIVRRVCSFLDSYAVCGVDVPIGVFSGLRLLSGYGKKIKFKLISITSAKCDLISTFTEAGINQVKHSLYAEVIPDVTLKAVGRSRRVSVKVSVLIYENIIVGKVPDTYLGADIIH